MTDPAAVTGRPCGPAGGRSPNQLLAQGISPASEPGQPRVGRRDRNAPPRPGDGSRSRLATAAIFNPAARSASAGFWNNDLAGHQWSQGAQRTATSP
ncbi:MAG: hypothetical protein ACM37V_00470 [Gemmatimonadota bacterium]